jgi:hypothetical protein
MLQTCLKRFLIALMAVILVSSMWGPVAAKLPSRRP